MQLYQFVTNKLEHKGIKIKSINHASYQEIYELQGSDGQSAKVSFYYNKKGHVKMPALMKASSEQFGDEVVGLLIGDNGVTDFSFVSDDWRRDIYTALNDTLISKGSQITYIIQTAYKDTVKITKDDSSLVVDMYYDGDGFFSSIICTYRSCDELWDEFKELLNKMSGKDAVTL